MLNYEIKLEIMNYFNTNMNTPYLFVINKFSKYIEEKRAPIHFTDLLEKIENNESLMLVASEHFHQTDKNLILGINEYTNPNIYKGLKLISSNNVSEFPENYRFDHNKNFFDTFISKWKDNQIEFEKDNLIFLHYLSDMSEVEIENYGIPIVNSYVLSMLQSPYVAKEFIKAYKNKKWTMEEFLCMNKSMINPLGLLSSLDTSSYVEFSEAFIAHAKRLKMSSKSLSMNLNIHKANNLDRSSSFQVNIMDIGRNIVNMATSYHNIDNYSLNKFPSEAKEVYYFNNKLDCQTNLEFLLNEPFLKNISMVKDLIKQAKVFGLIKKDKKVKVKNQEDFIEILLDQRNYEYIIFNVEMKEKNFTKIMKAFEELSVILSDKTGAKLTLQMSPYQEGRRFVFKVDSRCFKNKDDFSIYLKDLLIEMFSLDVKIAHNQIKDYKNTVPMIDTILEYVEKNIANANKAVSNKSYNESDLKDEMNEQMKKNIHVVKDLIDKTNENIAKMDNLSKKKNIP